RVYARRKFFRERGLFRLQGGHGVGAIIRRIVGAGTMVAAVTDPAEGKLAAGPGGLPVPVHHSRADTVAESFPEIAPVADQARRQAETRAVGLFQSRLEILHAHYLHERTEDLLVRTFARIRHVYDTWSQEGGLRTGAHGGQYLSTATFQFCLGLQQAVGGGGRYDRAQERLGPVRRRTQA